jgi:Tfp pilus assembly protein PilO
MATLANQSQRYRRYFTSINNLYQKKQTKVYTGIVLSLVTIAFFGFFAIRPTLITISGLVKEIKDKRMVADQMDQKIESLTQAQINYSQIKNDLDLVNQSLPLNPDLPILVKQLEALARLSSARIESLRFEKTNLQGEKAKEVQTVGFDLAVTGNYQNLKNFLNSLDNLRRITKIEGFAFKTSTGEENQVLVLTLTGHAYYLTREE